MRLKTRVEKYFKTLNREFQLTFLEVSHTSGRPNSYLSCLQTAFGRVSAIQLHRTLTLTVPFKACERLHTCIHMCMRPPQKHAHIIAAIAHARTQ